MRFSRYRLIEHPADLGFEVFGADRAELFANAGHALFDLMWDTLKIEAGTELPMAVSGSDLPELLVNFLGEFLYLFDAKAMLFNRLAIDSLTETQLFARAWGEPFDPERHEVLLAIKAITYHQLYVGPDGPGWRARVIVDI